MYIAHCRLVIYLVRHAVGCEKLHMTIHIWEVGNLKFEELKINHIYSQMIIWSTQKGFVCNCLIFSDL